MAIFAANIARFCHFGDNRDARYRSRNARIGRFLRERFQLRILVSLSGGPSRNRTGVQGFAVLCVTTPPSGRGAQMLRFCHGVNRASRFSHADRHGETSIAFAATRRVGARFSRPAPHERVHNPERWRHSGLLWSACFRLAGLAVSSRSGLAVAKGCVAFQSQYQRQVHWLHLLC